MVLSIVEATPPSLPLRLILEAKLSEPLAFALAWENGSNVFCLDCTHFFQHFDTRAMHGHMAHVTAPLSAHRRGGIALLDHSKDDYELLSAVQEVEVCVNAIDRHEE